ncbi:hypothetical protein H9W90_06530 [Polaribacter pectinis]|uniref:Uncharacterized protein n=1 Tax=Polaribacter pectinis TaxID=2738844 RepID=A0A7G9LDR9_9FLAO|nr:hypothetical protein [Polaribacter pectinis]QNM86768.1 hypothetical protein H9W90_06530 [Polaribacter pectinis]
MKSIHNDFTIEDLPQELVNSHVKIQFEINSQQKNVWTDTDNTCEFSRKNTI